MLPYIVWVLIKQIFGQATITSLPKEFMLHPMTLAIFLIEKQLTPYENLSYLYLTRKKCNLKLLETIDSTLEIYGKLESTTYITRYFERMENNNFC